MQAFVPLEPVSLLSGDWTLSWWSWICPHPRRPSTLWALSLDDGSVLSAHLLKGEGGAEGSVWGGLESSAESAAAADKAACERGVGGGVPSLIPALRWTAAGERLRWWWWSDSVELRGPSQAFHSVGSAGGWRHLVAIASESSRTLSLHLDGTLLASRRWAGPRRASGGANVRGLWVGGEPPATIAKHEPSPLEPDQVKPSRVKHEPLSTSADDGPRVACGG